MLKKKTMRAICIMIVSLMVFSNVTYASNIITKDETVYVTLDETGKPELEIVSDWLHSDVEGQTFKDLSNLENIVNVKTDEMPEIVGKNVIWNAKGNDIFYQGTINKELPIDIIITYYLDDKEVNPQDIVGKSGKLKITLAFENKEKHMVTIAGNTREVYTPFTVISTLNLPMKNFKNLKCDEGEIVNDGKNQVVTILTFPGLMDSFDALKDDFDITEDIDFPEEFIITSDVVDFNMGPIMFVVTPEIPEDDKIDDSQKLDEVQDDLDELEDASQKLADGSVELADGLDEAKEKLDDAKNDLDTMDPNEEIRSLVTDSKNVEIERMLINDAYDFYDMDKTLVDILPKYATYENIELYDLVKSDMDDVDIEYIIDDEFVRSLPDRMSDENIELLRKLLQDSDELNELDLSKVLKYTYLLSRAEMLADLVDNGMSLMDGIDESKIKTLEDLMKYKAQLNGLLENKDNLQKFVDSTNEFVENTSLFGLYDDMDPYCDYSKINASEKPFVIGIVNQVIGYEMANYDALVNASLNEADKVKLKEIINGALEYKKNAYVSCIEYGILASKGLDDDVKTVVTSAINTKKTQLENALYIDPIPTQAANEINTYINLAPIPNENKEQLTGLISLATNENNLDETVTSNVYGIVNGVLDFHLTELTASIDDGSYATNDTTKAELKSIVSTSMDTQISILDNLISENNLQYADDATKKLVKDIIKGVFDQKEADISDGITSGGLDEDSIELITKAILYAGFDFDTLINKVNNSNLDDLSKACVSCVLKTTKEYRNNVISMSSSISDIEEALKILNSLNTSKLKASIDYVSGLLGEAKKYQASIKSNRTVIDRVLDLAHDEEGIDYLNDWIPKLLSMKEDVDENQENIELLRDAIDKYDNDEKFRHLKNRIID